MGIKIAHCDVIQQFIFSTHDEPSTMLWSSGDTGMEKSETFWNNGKNEALMVYWLANTGLAYFLP